MATAIYKSFISDSIKCNEDQRSFFQHNLNALTMHALTPVTLQRIESGQMGREGPFTCHHFLADKINAHFHELFFATKHMFCLTLTNTLLYATVSVPIDRELNPEGAVKFSGYQDDLIARLYQQFEVKKIQFLKNECDSLTFSTYDIPNYTYLPEDFRQLKPIRSHRDLARHRLELANRRKKLEATVKGVTSISTLFKSFGNLQDQMKFVNYASRQLRETFTLVGEFEIDEFNKVESLVTSYKQYIEQKKADLHLNELNLEEIQAKKKKKKKKKKAKKQGPAEVITPPVPPSAPVAKESSVVSKKQQLLQARERIQIGLLLNSQSKPGDCTSDWRLQKWDAIKFSKNGNHITLIRQLPGYEDLSDEEAEKQWLYHISVMHKIQSLPPQVLKKYVSSRYEYESRKYPGVIHHGNVYYAECLVTNEPGLIHVAVDHNNSNFHSLFTPYPNESLNLRTLFQEPEPNDDKPLEPDEKEDGGGKMALAGAHQFEIEQDGAIIVRARMKGSQPMLYRIPIINPSA